MPLAVGYGPAYERAVDYSIVHFLLLSVLLVEAVDALDLDVVIESDLVNNIVKTIVVVTAILCSVSSTIYNTLKSEAKRHVHGATEHPDSCSDLSPFECLFAKNLRLLE